MRTISVILVLALLYSCNNSEKLMDDVINENQISKTDILVFKSSDELKDAIQKSISLSTEELKKYEESMGFKSFGRKCEEIYFSVDPDEFKSMDEVKNFVNANTEYLQLIREENGEYRLETVHYNWPERYLLNEEKMYQINNVVYKVFDKGIASANIENIDLLRSINEYNFLSYEDDSKINISERTNEYLSKDVANNCGTYAEDDGTVGTQRMTIEIQTGQIDQPDQYGNPVGSYAHTWMRIRVWKKSIFWFLGSARHITASWQLAVDYYDYYFNPGWNRAQYQYSCIDYYTNKIEHWWDVAGSAGFYANLKVHFGDYLVWAYHPGTIDNRAQVDCESSSIYPELPGE